MHSYTKQKGGVAVSVSSKTKLQPSSGSSSLVHLRLGTYIHQKQAPRPPSTSYAHLYHTRAQAHTHNTTPTMPTKKTSATGNGGAKPGARYVDMTQLYETGAHAMTDEDRDKVLQELSKPVSSAKPGELGEQLHMTLWEEFLAVLFLFFFIGR